MSWFDFLRGKRGGSVPEVPLLALDAVLFPGGLLGIRLFEPRHLAMVGQCVRQNAPFGICLAQRSKDADGRVKPYPVGTLAEIVGIDEPEAGMLHVTVRGGERFQIGSSRHDADGTLLAIVNRKRPVPKMDVPASRKRLLPVLLRIVGDRGSDKVPEPHAWDDAEWVGCRLAEAMPVQNLARQKLLELDNPLVRLEILERYLEQKQLLA